jgi:hypothetical protein
MADFMTGTSGSVDWKPQTARLVAGIFRRRPVQILRTSENQAIPAIDIQFPNIGGPQEIRRKGLFSGYTMRWGFLLGPPLLLREM